MIATGWERRLHDRDVSQRVALAALLASGNEEGAVGLRPLLLEFREAWLAAHRLEPGSPQDSFAGDRMREHLVESALPRLAADGIVADTSAAGWQEVRALGDWWREAAGDRARFAQSLLSNGTGGSVPAPAPAGSLLQGSGLSKSFKGRRVVDDVTVALRQGEIVGLLGPNGAGKTTTFYLLVGLIRADAGTVELDGADLTRAPMYQRARKGIGYLAQE
ncbi:MAG TPA: ATP-binding cassette domain-containing protein, partial [Gemmatimonadales bacterium]|nr:ATP-binding cassette domain-containing protein [Gemmatimonadales bacterium]